MNIPISNTDTSPSPDVVRLELWREAMAHLRYLNDEVWKRFQFFLGANLAVLLAMILIACRHPVDKVSALLLMILSLLGSFLTAAARYILKRNRIYYLQMLLKKTLIEDESGFYQAKISGTETDLAFPWRLGPEVFGALKQEPAGWVEKNIRPKGTIARWLFLCYEVMFVVYLAVLVALAVLA